MTATDSTLSSQAKQAEQTEQATFARFDESTAAEWRLIDQHFRAYQDDACRRVLDHLARLKGDTHGYPVDRYEHCLQTATRALRDGADEEMVVCALLHDIGDDLAPANHAEIAAAILEPFVDPLNVWMIRHHELFQGYHYRHFFGQDRHAREAYRDHPAYARTVRFCDEWDQTSFDPDYDTLPLSAFLPMIQRVMQRPPFGGLPDVVDDPQERS
ncbi:MULTISPECIES: HD domain-containing protein [Halomonas]|uniref:HD domain-containing protein n=1 Tax=Halomonas TaxID=2745 RepID=UPI001A8F1E96|nr:MULTISPECIES: HD domain-containing protein [Halomonas]MBN8411402.1 HD domain-containing protein [Halomonas litopenaei]MBY5985230.1 HD domain-containing protein [Halomonas sp. DP5Y7-2]